MVMRVAVIGGGAAGLCALRHLTAKPALFEAVGFEQIGRVGGTWVYTERIGKDENGCIIQSSMYNNLRTNLPKEVMAYPDFPFPPSLPSFISHTDVLQYLENYAEHYKLYNFLKLSTSVGKVEPVQKEGGVEWTVSYAPVTEPDKVETETFDAVMVCNGHYAVPLMPDIPGLDIFRGTVIHSHNYRHPETYSGKVVVCLGAASSGQDICLDLAHHAKRVILSHNKQFLLSPLPANVSQQVGIDRLTEDSIIFKNGDTEKVDTLLLCTGYRYKFPFLSDKCNVEIIDERVTPLYKHIIHSRWPTLSVMGICKTICPFPQFDNQVQFVLATLDGSLKLPTTEEMDNNIHEDFEERLKSGMPARYAHTMGTRQWEYNDSLSTMAGFKAIPRAVQNLYDEVHVRRTYDLQHYKRHRFELTGEDSFRVIDSQ